MSDGEPTLKCVIAWSDRRNLCSVVEEMLKDKLGDSEVRKLGDDSFVVYGGAEPDEVRNWVSGVLAPEEAVLVTEFEKWSGCGEGVPAEWLMRRGH
jgi:hypothetical protein